jgi:hypothetical protein
VTRQGARGHEARGQRLSSPSSDFGFHFPLAFTPDKSTLTPTLQAAPSSWPLALDCLPEWIKLVPDNDIEGTRTMNIIRDLVLVVGGAAGLEAGGQVLNCAGGTGSGLEL